MRFFCIGGEDAVRGFRLAGVEGRVVSDPAGAAAALEEAAALEDCGVVLITREALALARARAEGIRLERERPLIAEI